MRDLESRCFARRAAHCLWRGRAAPHSTDWLPQLLLPWAGGDVRNDPQTVPSKEYYHDLNWSPDGRSLVGVRASDAGIYAVSLDGREAGRLVAGVARSIDVAATGLIAIVRPVAPRCTSPPCIPDEIFVASPGGVARRLTFGGGHSPSWAPDGRRLAFIRRGNVYTARADGSGLRRLTFKGASGPVWSPDGKRIAFLRDGMLLTTRPNGKGLRRLRRERRCLGCGYGIGDWQALRKRR